MPVQLIGNTARCGERLCPRPGGLIKAQRRGDAVGIENILARLQIIQQREVRTSNGRNTTGQT